MLLKAVGDEEAVLLATEIANLPPLDREVVGRVLEEFVGKVSATRSISQGGIAQARRMLAGSHRRGARRPGHAPSAGQRRRRAARLAFAGGPEPRRPVARRRAPADGCRDPRPHAAERRFQAARRHAERLSGRGRRADRDDGPRLAGGHLHFGAAARQQAAWSRRGRLVGAGWGPRPRGAAQPGGRVDREAGARQPRGTRPRARRGSESAHVHLRRRARHGRQDPPARAARDQDPRSGTRHQGHERRPRCHGQDQAQPLRPCPGRARGGDRGHGPGEDVPWSTTPSRPSCGPCASSRRAARSSSPDRRISCCDDAVGGPAGRHGGPVGHQAGSAAHRRGGARLRARTR